MGFFINVMTLALVYTLDMALWLAEKFGWSGEFIDAIKIAIKAAEIAHAIAGVFAHLLI